MNDLNLQSIHVNTMGNFEENITTEHKKKTKQKGVSGRPSDNEIERRRKIAKRLYYTFNWKQSKEFLQKYENEIDYYNERVEASKKISKPTRETLKNDMYICNIPEAHQCIASKNGPLKIAFKKCISEISQVRFTCSDTDYCIYRSTRESVFPKKNLSNEIDALTQKKLNQQINPSTFVHLYIIFNSAGFEEYIKKVYFDNYDRILYATKHDKCIEIVFEFRCISFLLHGTRRALKQCLAEIEL